ncbi:uncharacterized protein EKO05_0005756 [Ascochyta rabiei]|uniref:Uncharacterized protein n=1 Tax=Didymella rabiei TaxID=5454 RepID=A0A163FA74_DIDRA|nr:uncharacterized protein EKO05_0005756 [Ascochyta rabiei]KZM24222.1 hypothetical protein ST47_g4589 [Ascochyta rabiei]UPX15305.1 hypothetical protein EKO05_0005756 [Ascochyta rabiei]
MRLKLLTGAPLRERLDFSDSSLIAVVECSGFDVKAWHCQSTEDQAALKWREVGPKSARLRTGWSQPHLPGTGLQGIDTNHSFAIATLEGSSGLSEHGTTNLDTTLTLDEQASAADEYLEHSLIFHDTLLSSQVVQDVAADTTVTSSSFLTTSFGTTSSGLSSPSPVDSHVLILQVPSAMAVTALGSLPSAQHLRSIYPQTPTPNLLCALTTTPERREVFVRKGGYKMDLWEVTVGDDTYPNFKVTFWLRPPRESNNEQNHAQVQLLHTLERLQVGNIILLRNIALTSFRDIVYGQSLNTAIARARTSVDVLMKSSGLSVAQVSGLPPSVVETFMRVKRWARSHIAGDTDKNRKRKGVLSTAGNATKRSFTGSAQDEALPPDTMEASS